jgi:tRNA U34 5-methylaminomethyl-2-thiouridine-forming methyltransferase MnmC
MSHELVAFANGSYSVRPLGGPEAMHSHIGPWQEARQIYVEPSGLAERLGESGPPLVLLDLGLGIAANALAALECFFVGQPRRDLHLFSFENSLEGLRLALKNRDRFAWLEKHGATVTELLSRGRWSSSHLGVQFHWELREGNFLDSDLHRALPGADFVFFDFYSPKANPELWGIESFKTVRNLCAPGATLTTYSAATSARAAMLLAGFLVGVGRSTDAKTQTTVATLFPTRPAQPLDEAWLEKLGRSQKPLPNDLGAETPEQALRRVREHTQFRNPA